MSKVVLGDICEFINGGAWSDKDYVAFGIPVLKVTNCKPQGFQIDEIDYLSFEAESKYRKNRLFIDDVIIATVGSHPTMVDSAAGRISVVTSLVEGFYLNQNAVCLRTRDPNFLDQRYLGYLCKSHDFQHYIQNKGRGAANQMRIAIGSIKEYCFELPPIARQKKIANILYAYDSLIENNQKQIKLLEEAAHRLYKEWFVDLRFPGYENTPIVDGVPQGWRLDEIKSVVSLLSGYAFKSSDFVDDGKYKIVTIKNVQDGNFDGEKVNAIAEMPSKMPNHCILNDGDILLSLTGNVGRVCLVNGENYLLNQRVAKLDSKYPSYAYCLFRSKDMFDTMNNLANGAAQQNLSPIRTENVRILIPSDRIIEKFENVVSPMIVKTLVLNKSNSNLKQARDRLLPKLMSGELEV